MVFCVLDANDECYGIYKNGELFLQELPIESGEFTWEYSSNIPCESVEYLSLYAQGKSLDELCPESLREKWDKVSKKMTAFYTSFDEAKINLAHNCVYDLIPQRHLKEYCEIKSQLIDYLRTTLQRPKHYDQLLRIEKLISDITKRDLNIDLSEIRKVPSMESRKFSQKVNSVSKNIVYNQFKAVTGRLTTKPHTFPILNMPKKHRYIIKPQNSVFLELDYNAAELRTYLALVGRPQPERDIHTHHADALGITRDAAKTLFFAWLYGSQTVDGSYFEKHYDIEEMDGMCPNEDKIITPYGREIIANAKHKRNYMLQSTTSDIVLEQAFKLKELLKDCESYVTFIMHDAVTIDLHSNEKTRIPEIVECFRNTRFGELKTNVSLGRDFGKMKKKEQW